MVDKLGNVKRCDALYGKCTLRVLVEYYIGLVVAVGIERVLYRALVDARRELEGYSLLLIACSTARGKGDAENLVRQSDLDWTIFRPSVIFGQDDSFINLFKKISKITPIIPLAGYHARFQPVSVRNVAQVFVQTLVQPGTIHQAYDLGGPKIYSLSELVRFAGKLAGRSPLIIPLSKGLGYLQAFCMEKLPGPTLMSRDNVTSMLIDNILQGEGNVIKDQFGLDVESIEGLLL